MGNKELNPEQTIFEGYFLNKDHFWDQIVQDKSQRKKATLFMNKLEAQIHKKRNPLIIHNKTYTRGVIYHKGKSIYFGGLQNDQPHGNGYMFNIDGIFSKGTYENGQPHGRMLWYNTEKKLIFDSRWDHGKFMIGFHLQSEVELIFKSQNQYKLKFGDGSTFQGMVTYEKEQILLQKGTLKYKNANVYEGQFRNNKKHGSGKYWLSDDEYVSGRWEDGQFKKGSHFVGEASRQIQLQ